MVAIVMVKIEEEVLVLTRCGVGIIAFLSPEDGVQWAEQVHNTLNERRMSEAEAKEALAIASNTRIVEVEDVVQSVIEFSGQSAPMSVHSPIHGIKILPEYFHVFEEGLKPRLTTSSYH